MCGELSPDRVSRHRHRALAFSPRQGGRGDRPLASDAFGDAELAVEQCFDHRSVVGMLVDQLDQPRRSWNRNAAIADEHRDMPGSVHRCHQRSYVTPSGSRLPGTSRHSSTYAPLGARSIITVPSSFHVIRPGSGNAGDRLEVHAVAARVPRGRRGLRRPSGRSTTWTAFGEPAARIARRRWRAARRCCTRAALRDPNGYGRSRRNAHVDHR